MKITSLKGYRWHSINLVPNLSSVAICTDEAPFRTTGRLFQLTVFGWVISLLVEYEGASEIAKIGKFHGPLWSRRRKLWYRDT
jgi:hypothetical protein